LSLFGDTALLLAAGIWVKVLTGSNSAAGLVMFCLTLPSVFGPLFGMLADRVRRRPLMIATNGGMAAVTLLLLSVSDADDVWLIFAVITAQGIATSILNAAQMGLFFVMIPRDLLGAANSVQVAVQESMKLLAPVAGAGLFVWLGGGATALVDSLTFVVAVLALSMIRVDEPAPTPRTGRWRTEVLEGFRHIARVAPLRRVVLASGAVLLSTGLSQVAVFALVASGLHRTPPFVGVLLSLQGLGSVVTSFVAAPMMRRLREGHFVGLGVLIHAVGVALMMMPTLPTVVAGQVLRGLGLPWLVIGAYTLMQRMTPVQLQGRAASATTMILFVPSTLTLLAAAWLGAVLSGTATYLVCYAVIAAVGAAAGLYLLARPAADVSSEEEDEPATESADAAT
ncbi:MAG TPA: MFS transporter, partial [Micromonosporaceae bacterium]|nr:MFS transporter [Micromonosporaceae bacterium]